MRDILVNKQLWWIYILRRFSSGGLRPPGPYFLFVHTFKQKTYVFNIIFMWAYHWSDCFAHSLWINFHLLFLVFCITMTPWTNSLKLRSIYFGYVVHNDIPPSSHSTKALNLVTPSSIEILWQLVIKWENGPGPDF